MESAAIHSSGQKRTASSLRCSSLATVVLPEPGKPHTMINLPAAAFIRELFQTGAISCREFLPRRGDITEVCHTALPLPSATGPYHSKRKVFPIEIPKHERRRNPRYRAPKDLLVA